MSSLEVMGGVWAGGAAVPEGNSLRNYCWTCVPDKMKIVIADIIGKNKNIFGIIRTLKDGVPCALSSM